VSCCSTLEQHPDCGRGQPLPQQQQGVRVPTPCSSSSSRDFLQGGGGGGDTPQFRGGRTTPPPPERTRDIFEAECPDRCMRSSMSTSPSSVTSATIIYRSSWGIWLQGYPTTPPRQWQSCFRVGCLWRAILLFTFEGTCFIIVNRSFMMTL
jgi:hypothetical protein